MRLDMLLSSNNGDWVAVALREFCTEFEFESIVKDQSSDTMKNFWRKSCKLKQDRERVIEDYAGLDN